MTSNGQPPVPQGPIPQGPLRTILLHTLAINVENLPDGVRQVSINQPNGEQILFGLSEADARAFARELSSGLEVASTMPPMK